MTQKSIDTLSRRSLIKAMAASLLLPALPLSAANALTYRATPSLGCGEEFPWFGAHYPDAVCIDGYLWDLDSCDEPKGELFTGGDYPCPYCNARKFLEYLREEVEDRGWIDFTEGATPLENPYLSGCRFPHLAAPFQTMWTEGYRAASVDPMAIEDRIDFKKNWSLIKVANSLKSP